MIISTYSMLNDDWEGGGDNTFVSPINPDEGNQTIIFPAMVKNAFISENEDVIQREWYGEF